MFGVVDSWPEPAAAAAAPTTGLTTYCSGSH